MQFWTTWCPYCRRDHPSVETITDEFKDKDLIVLAVNIGEPKKKVRKYLEDSPRSCKIVLMEDTNLAAMFATRVYPVYVLIDRDGGLAGRQNGASGEDGLRRLLGQSWHGSGVSGGLMRAHDLRGRQRRRGKEPARLTSPQRPQPIDPFII